MKKTCFAILFILLFTSCSHVLNLVIAPFAPTFTPEVTTTVNGPKINCHLTKDHEGSKTNWTQNYAYYIYRSTKSPYTDWNLIARIYIPDSTKIYSGLDDNKHKEYDFTLPSDGINYSAYSLDFYTDTDAPTNTTIYYRLSKVILSYDKTENDDGEITEEYELTHEVSSWISVEN